MKNEIVFPSQFFLWRDGKGVAEASELGIARFPSTFDIVSARTGRMQQFVLDRHDSGYEDGWDGEMAVYVSRQNIKVTIFND